MNPGFDPYRQWLDLEVSTGPVDHYQLLGLRRFEADATVIAEAADRALARVRSYRPGVHSREWARLLDEITAAKTCLADTRSREGYDGGLRERSVGEVPPSQLAAASGQPTDPSEAPHTGLSAGYNTNPSLQPMFVSPALVSTQVPGLVVPHLDPMAPASAPTLQYAAPTSAIPGFGNAQTAIPGFPSSGVTGHATPLADPMAPLDTGAIARASMPAAPMPNMAGPSMAGPSMAGPSMQVPGFANVAPQFNPMDPLAPLASPMGQAAPMLMAQPITAAQPAMAQPAVAPAANAAVGPPVVAAYIGQPADAVAPFDSSENPDDLGDSEGLGKLGGSGRSATAIAKSRSQAGIMAPILAGAAVGLVLLTMGGVYLFMGGSGEPDVVAQSDPGYPSAFAPGTIATSSSTSTSNEERDGSADGTSSGGGDPADSPGPVVSAPEPNPPAMENPTGSAAVPPDPVSPQPAPPTPIPVVPPAPAPPAPTPPAPTPPATTPPEPAPAKPQPSRTDLVQLSTKLKSARAALAKHDFAATRRLLESAAPLVMLEAHQTKFERLSKTTEYAAGFHEAIVAGVGKLQAGEALQIKDSAVGIVETSAQRVVLRVAGVNKRYELSELPLGLAVAIAHQAVSSTDARTIAQKACYVVTSPEADAAAVAKARGWFVEASASLPDVANLAGVMEDDYDLVAGFVAPTAMPVPAPTADPNTGPTREEVTKLATALTAARRAIATRDHRGAETHLAAAESLAKLPDHKQKLWRLQRLAEHVRAFDQAMQEAVAALKPGDVIKVGSSTELIVERVNPASLLVEVAGLKKTYPLNDPPLALAIALVQTGLAPEDPLTKAIQAAFVVVSKNSDDRSLAKARTWYEEAAAGNQDLADLGGVIDDDYNLLKGFQEELP